MQNDKKLSKKKLVLKKETLSVLDSGKLSQIVGGAYGICRTSTNG